MSTPRDTRLKALILTRSLPRRDALSLKGRLLMLRNRSSRKKVRLVLFITTVLMQVMTMRMPREVWTFDRSKKWWDHIVMSTFTPRDWMESFRVSHDTFLYICSQLEQSIIKFNTRFRRAISVQQRVAITIWVLATTSEYRTIAQLFGVARCTVCCIVKETCAAIVKVLLPKYVLFPVGDKLKETVQGFYDHWGIPQCAGSIDGSHIPVRPPALNHTDYYNRKGWYSILVQAVVDHNYLFTDLYIGWPGSVHDARVLANSGVYQKANNKEILQGDSMLVNDQDIPIFLVGDSAYPLLPWLIKPFAMTSSLTEQQKTFNYRICRGRVVVEIAFGRLKARWRRLLKQNDMYIENVPNVVGACCVLHNICEIHNDVFNEEWLQDMNEDGADPIVASSNSVDSGNDIRDALTEYFTHNPLQ